MTGWHRGAMVAFDLETDSPDPQDARIITACVAVIDGTGRTPPEVTTWVLRPVRPIPADAAEIHGYTTDRATAEGIDPARGVKEIALRLGEATQAGLPIVAYNAVYDLTVTDREMRRHGLGAVQPAGLRVIDPFVLDKALDRYRKGKRTLTAACEHYGVRLDGAHDAAFDALAAARVAWAIGHRTPRVAAMSLDDLHAFQVTARQEQDDSFGRYLRSLARDAKTVDEQIELHRRADGCTGAWPVLPYEPQAALL